jgi:hypothetical protein
MHILGKMTSNWALNQMEKRSKYQWKMLIVNFNPQQKSLFWTKKVRIFCHTLVHSLLQPSCYGINVTFKTKDTHQMLYLSFYDLSLQ